MTDFERKKKSETSGGKISYEEQWKRAVADYHNLQKQQEKERSVLVEILTGQVLNSFLPLYDSLYEAQRQDASGGIKVLITQFLTILKGFGFELLLAEGQEFNPEWHEAVEVVIGREDNKVVEVLRDGFIREDGLCLRPARVKVAKINQEKQEENHE